MSYIQNGEINPDIADALYELGNVGVGMASAALSELLGAGVSIGIPRVAAWSAIPLIAPDERDDFAVGVLMSLQKTLGGAVLFVIDSGFLTELVRKLTGLERSGFGLVEDEESLSAICEAANIMAASYMKALGAYTGIRIYLSPVMAGADTVEGLIGYAAEQLAERDAAGSVCVETGFSVANGTGGGSAGRVIMFPDESSVEKIVGALNAPHDL